jgi:hypothetical protein
MNSNPQITQITQIGMLIGKELSMSPKETLQELQRVNRFFLAESFLSV